MPSGTGLDRFGAAHPDKYFDVSIAEQHAVSLCAGLAKGGLKPIFCVYSSFLQRAFDQILHDVCLNNLGVVFAIDRAGAIGSDGVTHQGVFDLSYLNAVPNLTVLSPKDGHELKKMLKFAFSLNTPVAIRYPKGYSASTASFNNADSLANKHTDSTCTLPDIDYTKWEILKKTTANIYILACGSRMIDIALSKDLNANIINARSIKPLDYTFLDSINNNKNLIITLEDNISNGGFSSVVLDYLISINPKNPPLFAPLSHKTTFSDIRNIDDSLKNSRLDIENIQKIIQNFLA